ncbi:MAG: O-antigen ligase family protein [Clostridia bacterium]|nr:O-antigen ligase family protein [Clostridia bacterium]
MEYILSAALLVLNLIDYERDLGHAVFTAFSAVLFAALFFFVHRKTRNFLASCFIMMCHTWQISWINIFGDPTAQLQLPWFYIIGVLIAVYAVFNIRDCMKKEYNLPYLLVFLVFLIAFNYPLVISESVAEGVKEYIMIGFFMIVLLVAYLFRDTIPKSVHTRIKSAFIFAAVTTSVLLIFQYFMYIRFGLVLFKINLTKYFANDQVSCHLLMEDHSCSTIMLGAAVFYIAERITKKRWFVYVPAMIAVFVALALTSRRTSTFTLIVVAAAYVIIHYRGLGKKLVFLVIFAAAALIMIYYLLVVRPVDTMYQAISDNGRFANYSAALAVIRDNPLGVGYDGNYLESLMADGIVPHNTVIRWVCMGSIILALPLVLAIGYVVVTAKRKRLPCEFWGILYSVIASNFIPDILNARYFIIPCALVFLVNMSDEEDKETKPLPEAPPEDASAPAEEETQPIKT